MTQKQRRNKPSSLKTPFALSRLGFGATRLGNLYKKVSDEDAFQCVAAAYEQGIRYFDTAPQYGLGVAECRLGQALEKIGARDVVISTKVGRLLEDCAADEATPENFVDVPQKRIIFDYSYDGIMKSHEASLMRLKRDRVNILLVHDICAFSQGGLEASDRRRRELFDLGGYRALDELKSCGQIDAIGAGVNDWDVCVKLLHEADFDCFMLAGRYTLLEQSALEVFLPLCQDRGVSVLLGSPFNSGILATGAMPNAHYNYRKAPQDVLVKVKRIQAICHRFDTPMMAAAIQFGLSHPSIEAVVAGPANANEVVTLTKMMDVEIPGDFWSVLKKEGLISVMSPVDKEVGS